MESPNMQIYQMISQMYTPLVLYISPHLQMRTLPDASSIIEANRSESLVPISSSGMNTLNVSLSTSHHTLVRTYTKFGPAFGPMDRGVEPVLIQISV